jgi:hypothetical protein
VRHEDRHVAVRAAARPRERVGRDQVGRQRDDAREPLGMPQSRVQRDRAALRKTRQHDRARPARRAPPRARSAPRHACCERCTPARSARLLKSFSRMSYHARIA